MNFVVFVIVVMLVASSLALMLCRNAFRAVIALVIFEAGIFLFAIFGAYIPGGGAPIVGSSDLMANPLPHAMILTAIVIAACNTAMAVAMLINLQSHIASLNLDDLRELGG